MKENTQILIELLQKMKRIRAVEETIASRYSEWKMRCPTHLCSGQEAVAAAVGQVLRKDDFAVSSHRAHGHYLAKGGDLNRMIAEIYGKSDGCSSGKGGSMHLIDTSVGFMGSTAIVGGTIPVGVGLALSIKLKKTNQVSCVFFGDGSIEEGVFYESVNFAVLKNLPVLFICENNFYSVYSPLKVRQPENRAIYKMVSGIGCRSEHGDGNNVVDVYDKVNTAVVSIRDGGGPMFFEFKTYRWREHCGHNFDNDLGYRTQEEYLSWKEKDPISAMESYMFKEKYITQNEIDEMQSEIQKEIEKAFEFAEKSPFPNLESALTDIYA
ncbi:MAG: thiamine pyrophosphate-dependent dehydrogenase E1 component subunit alpha [Elusimicrobia bacterium]|nr:thiamine pyrophosphate-dependent dehydrogenase E1 component subunit alpha [Elusimicrobiota bacterium]